MEGRGRLLLIGEQDFMTAVSLQCKVKRHHPEWSNVRSLFPSSYLLSFLPLFVLQTSTLR